jgi:DNA-binding MarR family transcriptional regulator
MFRKDDPFTSKLAAEQVDFRVHHFDQILAVLVLHGPQGKDGIADRSMLDPNQVARRLKEMMKQGLVKLTGKTVKSKSNREEREWELA